MKRIARNPGKFEPLELFTAIGREQGYNLQDPGHVEDFMTKVSAALKASQENLSLIHGKRIETLFKHLAAGLGGCLFIKSEDAGEAIAIDADIIPPDYRLILNDGTHIFVEVKNCNHPNPQDLFELRKSYSDKIDKYAQLHGIPVYYAIYFHCINRWVLLRREVMKETEHHHSTNLMHALANNEMALLGDMMVGTRPDLKFELVADETKECRVSEDGQAYFTPKEVNFYCNDVKIEDSQEKSLAYYLMRYGEWESSDSTAVMGDDDELLSVYFTFEPNSRENMDTNGFELIGNLSTMITAAFNEQTIREQTVTAIDTRHEPEVFGITIPKDYKGKVLPLWRIQQQPNPDFAIK